MKLIKIFVIICMVFGLSTFALSRQNVNTAYACDDTVRFAGPDDVDIPCAGGGSGSDFTCNMITGDMWC